MFGGLFSSCAIRVCRFNKSRRVNAAPQKQVNGFSLVSRINQPKHPLGHINTAYECERDAPDAPSSERSDRSARRHEVSLRRWNDEPRGDYGTTAAASRHWRAPMYVYITREIAFSPTLWRWPLNKREYVGESGSTPTGRGRRRNSAIY